MSNRFKAKKSPRILPAPAPVAKRLWHYTAPKHLGKIIESGSIKVASLGSDPKELPVVWFSSNSDFEQTARMLVKDRETGAVRLDATRDEMFKAGYPPVRIEINLSEVRAYDWETYKKISGISGETAADVEKSAIGKGADPSEWYASFQPIRLVGDCKFPIEIWNGGRWIDIEQARPGAGKKG